MDISSLVDRTGGRGSKRSAEEAGFTGTHSPPGHRSRILHPPYPVKRFESERLSRSSPRQQMLPSPPPEPLATNCRLPSVKSLLAGTYASLESEQHHGQSRAPSHTSNVGSSTMSSSLPYDFKLGSHGYGSVHPPARIGPPNQYPITPSTASDDSNSRPPTPVAVARNLASLAAMNHQQLPQPRSIATLPLPDPRHARTASLPLHVPAQFSHHHPTRPHFASASADTSPLQYSPPHRSISRSLGLSPLPSRADLAHSQQQLQQQQPPGFVYARHHHHHLANSPKSTPARGSLSDASSANGQAGTERYSCELCSKAFSRPSSLRIHMHSHTGHKPYACPERGCGKRFSVRSNMRRHQRGCHVGQALSIAAGGTAGHGLSDGDANEAD